MSKDINAPAFPESVADGTVAVWHKKAGDQISRDEPLVDIETDKVVLEVVAPADGVLLEIVKDEGETVLSNELVGKMDEGASGGTSSDSSGDSEADASESDGEADSAASKASDEGDERIAPAARKLMAEKGLEPRDVKGTGKNGLITKEDVLNHKAPQKSAPVSSGADARQEVEEALIAGERVERRVPMTRMRARIAERLLNATQNTAMLTTFNEVDMSALMALRSQYKEQFEKSHNGTRLGFMGFFVKASCEALKRFPSVNASIDGSDIVYHGYQDVGVAVGTDKGLVVPILRDTDNMSLAKIEEKIRDFGLRARDNKLSLDEMTGGTFTISNGGVFGSLLSTPILNPPQTGILGMHKIQERPMAVNGEVKILPMMYLALSYDHRLIDGGEAVQFLVAIKQMLEDPARILLEL